MDHESHPDVNSCRMARKLLESRRRAALLKNIASGLQHQPHNQAQPQGGMSAVAAIEHHRRALLEEVRR